MNRTDDQAPWPWGEPADGEPSAREIPLPADPQAPLPLPLRKFCPACGAAWGPDWADCPHCQARVQADQATAQAPAGPGVGSALGLYFALLACSLLGIIAIQAGAPGAHCAIAATVLMTVVIVGWALAWRPRIRAFLGTPGPAYGYLLAPAAAVCTYGLACLSLAAFRATGIPVISISKLFLDAGYGWPTVILFVCIQPAIFEELAFRGVILEALKGPLSTRDAALVSAMLFMTLHLAVPSFPLLFALGLALAVVRLKTGSLYPCMVLHGLHNALVLVAEAQGV